MRTCSLLNLGLTPYADALALQRQLATLRAADRLGDTLLLVEHPPVITLGRAGQKTHLRVPQSSLAELGVEFFEVERGGDISYHGPGQLVGYPILKLAHHGRDVHRYLRQLEEVLIETLARFGISAGRVPGRTGVWVGQRKIASMGVHVSRWVTRHGFALNVNMALAPFELIVPCGIQGVRMTSMMCELSHPIAVSQVAAAVVECFEGEFGVVLAAESRPEVVNGIRHASMGEMDEPAGVGSAC